VGHRFVAAAPSGPVVVPAAVLAIAAGEPAVTVWVNECGGVTFSLPDSRRRTDGVLSRDLGRDVKVLDAGC